MRPTTAHRSPLPCTAQPRRLLTLASLACGALASTAVPRWAHAHGNKVFGTRGVVAAPQAQPGAATAPLLVPLSAGALVRVANGAQLAWICPEALLGPAADLVAARVTGSGALLVGNANSGLQRSDDGGCSWHDNGFFAGANTFAALALSPKDPSSWFVASNAAADGHGSVWATYDGGTGYRRLGFAAQGVFLTDVVADGEVLVASGSNNRAQNSAQLFVSRDGGSHWQPAALTGAPAFTSEVLAFALGRAGWAAAALDATTNAATVLLAERPEGPWRVALAMGQPVRQVAADAKGERVVIGGTTHVVQSLDGGRTFVQPARPRGNGCAGATAEGLWTCGDPAVGDGFALATLAADGATWTPKLQYNQLVGPYHCPQTSATYARCMPAWPQAAQLFGARAAPPRVVARLAAGAKSGGAMGCSALGAQAGEPWWHTGMGQLGAALVTYWVMRPQRPLARRLARLRAAPAPKGRRR